MRVRLLGGLEVEGRVERDLGSRKARTLLKVLALGRGSPVSTDRLVDILWGDEPPARPVDQVYVLVSRLRRALGAEHINRSDAGYALGPVWLDVDEVRSLADAAAIALAEGRTGAARAATEAALALVRGPLLPDEEGEWVEAERAGVGATVARVQRLAIDSAAIAGDHVGAATLAEQALAGDPHDEVVLRALMDAHLATGRPASALAAYARVRHHLAEGLGVSPTADTEAVYARALAAADGDPLLADARSPMAVSIVGRGRELAMLDASLAAATDGTATYVIIEGEAGIGKTALVDEWTSLVGHSATVLRGNCDQLGRDLPLQPVVDALVDHLRMVGEERAATILGAEADALALLLGPISGPSATIVTDTEAARDRVLASLLIAIERAGDGQPVILVVEDLHVAGRATVEWLAFATRRTRRMLVLATTRAGEDLFPDATSRIELGPLDLDAVVELVGAERAVELHERTGGNPLLLAALAGADDDQLPATLQDAVAKRVASLGDDVAATLRAAATLGPDCDLELVAGVTDVPILDALDHLEAASRAGLVVERGRGFGFKHELVRAALEASTGSARRALVHRRAATSLAARPRIDPLAVAVHARSGGDVALAASSFVDAAAVAAARFDLSAAEDHLTAALDLDPTADTHAARARVRMSRQSLEGAEADARRAVALGGGASALEVAGWVAYYLRRYDNARAFSDEAVTRATDDDVRSSALALGGRVRHGAGDLKGAVELLTSVDSGTPAVRGIAEVWLAQARLHEGRPIEALAALARPMLDPDSLAHPWAPLHLRFNRALALGQLGRVTEALRVAAELDDVVAQEGAVGARFAAPAANVRAWILRWSGRVEEADERNAHALEVTGGDAGPSADAMAEGHYVALLDLADGCLLRGDFVAAASLVDRLAHIDSWEGTMAWHQRHRIGLLRARLALLDGASEAAATLAAEVAEDAADRGAGRYEILGRAIVGLADPSIPIESLVPVIAGLGRCAVLDGWPLVAALAAERGSDEWRTEAERRAAVIVATSGDHSDAARRFVSGILEG